MAISNLDKNDKNIEQQGKTYNIFHDDVIKWKHFPRYRTFVRGIHRSPVNSPHKGQWRGALMFSLICVCINGWVNNREAGDLRRYRAHNDVIVMLPGWKWLLKLLPYPQDVVRCYLPLPRSRLKSREYHGSCLTETYCTNKYSFGEIWYHSQYNY